MRLTLKMRRRIIICLAAMLIVNQSLFFFTVSAAAQNVASQPEKNRATIEMLNGFIRREMADKHLPGIALALVDGSLRSRRDCEGA